MLLITFIILLFQKMLLNLRIIRLSLPHLSKTFHIFRKIGLYTTSTILERSLLISDGNSIKILTFLILIPQTHKYMLIHHKGEKMMKILINLILG